MTEIEVKFAARYIKRKRGVAIGKNLLKTLTEPITNSDDSYRIITTKTGSSAVFPLDIIVDKKKRIIKIIDRAEGMTNRELKEKFQEYGAAKSGIYEGYNTRGLFGQGISDVLFYHHKGAIKSIKNGEASCCSFYEKNGRPYINVERQKGDTKELSKKWGINAERGTVVEFVTAGDTPIHEHDNLVKKLSSFYVLRLINSNAKRLIRLTYHDTRGVKTNTIRYSFPHGELVEHKELTMQFENYNPVKIDIELYKSSSPLKMVDDERENGLLVSDNEKAVYDLTFFDLDNLPGADKFFGFMKLTGAREIILDKINDKKRPEEILMDSRDGFNKSHEFYKQLAAIVKKWLFPILNEEKTKKTNEGVSESVREKHKRAFDELNKLYTQLTGEDISGTIRTKKKNKPVGGLQFVRDNISITAGKRYGIQLLVDTSIIKPKSIIKLSSSKNKVGFSPTTICVEKANEENDVFAKTIIITGATPKSADTLEATYKNYRASVVISIVPEEIIYPENGIIFSPDYFRAVVDRESILNLYVDLALIKSGNKISLSSSSNSIILKKSRTVVPKHIRSTSRIAKVEVQFIGNKNEESGIIEATYKNYSTQCRVDIKERTALPTKNPAGKFKDWAFDDAVPLSRQTTFDPSPGSPTQGFILINSKHPINKYYFGEDPKEADIEESHEAQLYLAELILNESLQQMIPEAFQKGALPIIYGAEYDILTYIAQKKSEYGPTIYSYFVEEQSVLQKRLQEKLNMPEKTNLTDSDIIDGLGERERKMLEMRFGLNDQWQHTLDEIGREYNITRERVRQIINNALSKKYGNYSYQEGESKDFIGGQEKKISTTIDKIITTVAKFYNIDTSQIKKRTREKEIAKPRQIAMYLLRKVIGLSFPAIGNIFGLDHTTVLYAFEKISNAIAYDMVLQGQIDSLKMMVSEK